MSVKSFHSLYGPYELCSMITIFTIRVYVRQCWTTINFFGETRRSENLFTRPNNIWNHIESDIDYSIKLYWENVNWVRFLIFHLYIFLFKHVSHCQTTKRSKIPASICRYAWPCEDSDNITNLAWPLNPPPATGPLITIQLGWLCRWLSSA
jgi:hypothetical protein